MLPLSRLAGLCLAAVTLTLGLVYSLRSVNLLSVGLVLGVVPAPLTKSALLTAQLHHDYGEALQSDLPRRAPPSATLTLMSFNIRYSNPFARKAPSLVRPDTTLPERHSGEVSWSVRRYWVADAILFHDPDIVILQEVLHNQLVDIAHLLGENYVFVAAGRDDGKTKGEAVPVFWKRDKFSALSAGNGGVGEAGFEHFWLSETPDVVGSKGWDADLPRMCTHVALRLSSPTGSVDDIASPYTLPIHIFSTHYDHRGVLARAKSSELLVAKARASRLASKKAIARPGAEPLMLIGGDLNSPREEEGWKNLVRGHHGVSASAQVTSDAEHLSFRDVQLSLPTLFGKKSSAQHPSVNPARGVLSYPYGPASTFTDWTDQRDRPSAQDRIDFWFIGDNQSCGRSGRADMDCEGPKWRIKTFGVLSSWSAVEGGWRISDHRPILTRLRWE
ncbi:unnamed protein product [Parajaminaea phylloscopi]